MRYKIKSLQRYVIMLKRSIINMKLLSLLMAFLLLSTLILTTCGEGDGGGEGGDGNGEVDGLVLKLATDKELYTIGESVTLTVTLTNEGSRTLTVLRPLVSPNFIFFDVTGPDGTSLFFNGPWFKLKPLPESIFVNLTSGTSTSHTFILNDLYELTEPGLYKITALYLNSDDGARFGFNALITEGLRSNSVTIELTL